ncbi:aldo/keto reductase [Actinocrispum sp. NPDC049592]|uniref:aldo/keto reductase n=1 Tax=Actinocrispum sp. NPDC049592 TaxID=3154835 RepID=UPI003435EF76
MSSRSPFVDGLSQASDTIPLRGGVPMPVIGLGVFTMSGRDTQSAVAAALKCGYRHVDTASIYGNEAEVGSAVRRCGVADVFVTTKLWNADQGFGQTISAFERSRKRLDVDVVDLFLMHWPVPGKRLDTWRAMEQLLDEGRVRAIGVSNFMAHHLDELLGAAVHPPAVNQIELSPFSYGSRRDVVDLCQDAGIVVQAYSPLTKGALLHDAAVSAVAGRHQRGNAQILIRWALQKGLVPLPRSGNPQRIAANADVFGFSLSEQDMAELDALDRGLVTPGWDPTQAP